VTGRLLLLLACGAATDVGNRAAAAPCVVVRRLGCGPYHLLLLVCGVETDLANRACPYPALGVIGLVTCCFACVLLLLRCCVVACRAAAACGVETCPCRCCMTASRAAVAAAAVGVHLPLLLPSRCRLCFWHRSSWTVQKTAAGTRWQLVDDVSAYVNRRVCAKQGPDHGVLIMAHESGLPSSQ
jgi:hypothetical protein